MPRRQAAIRCLALQVVVGLWLTVAPAGADDGVLAAVQVLESQGEFELAWAHLDPHLAPADGASPAAPAAESVQAGLRLLGRRRDHRAALELLERNAARLDASVVSVVGAALALEIDDPKRALGYLRSTVAPPGVEGLARFLEADALHRVERWGAAQSAARAASATALPTEMKRRLRVIEARAAFESGDLRRLRRLAPLLGRDARRDDLTAFRLVDLSRAALARGDVRQARTWLLELLESRPAPAESAFVTLQRAIRTRKWRPNASETLLLARYEIDTGRPAQARARLLELVDDGSSLERNVLAEAWVAVAETHQRQGHQQRCLHVLYEHRGQIEATPSEPELLRLRARSLRRLGDEDAAIAVYRELAQRFPRHPRADDALYEVGWRFEIRRDFGQAENTFGEVERRFPRSKLADDAAFRRALCAFRDKRYADALSHFGTMRARYRDSSLLPRALYWSMWIEEARGDSMRAAEFRRRLQEEHPANYFTILAAGTNGADLGPNAHDSAPSDASDGALQRAYRHHDLYMAAVDTLRTLCGTAAPPSFQAASPLWRFCLDYGLATIAQWEARRLESRFARNTGALLELLEASYKRGAHERLVRLSFKLSLLLPEPRYARAIEIVRYPAPYSITLEAQARRHGLSHAALLALMRHESAFDTAVDSHAGARGLMQLMPAVGLQVARQLGRRGMHIDELYDPITNMTLGCQLFSDELARAQGDLPQALAAYNAGSTPAARWRRRLLADDPPELYLDVAEYVETRSYLERVLGSQEVYRRIYGLH